MIDNSSIRVKVKTNRFLNLLVSIQRDRTIEQLSDRIIKCFYELGDQNASMAPKSRDITVIALKFQSFFISKSQIVGNILKDRDEIECVFSGAKQKSIWKSNNRLSEAKNNNNFRTSNTPQSSADHQVYSQSKTLYERPLTYENRNRPGKRQRKRSKLLSKDQKRVEPKSYEWERADTVRNPPGEPKNFNPFMLEYTENEEKRSMKIEKYEDRTKQISFSNKNENEEIGSQEQHKTALERYDKSFSFQNLSQEKHFQNSNNIKDPKEAEDKLSHQSNSSIQKIDRSNYQSEPLYKQLPFKVPAIFEQQSQQLRAHQQNKRSDTFEVSSLTKKQKTNSFNGQKIHGVFNDDSCAKFQHEKFQVKVECLSFGKMEKRLSQEIQKTENVFLNQTFENFPPAEKKTEGIIYCYKRQKQNEVSKTFIESESETNSLGSEQSNEEAGSLFKEIACQPKFSVAVNIQTKHSKKNTKFQ